MEIKYDRPRNIMYTHTHANIYMAHQIRGWPRNVNSSNNHLSKIDTRQGPYNISSFQGSSSTSISRAILQCRRGELRCAIVKLPIQP